MQITHFGHACVLVETHRARLLIDPGTLSSGFENLVDLDGVLITHEHADHVDDEKVVALLANNPAAQLILDERTATRMPPSVNATVACPGDSLTVGAESVAVLGGLHAPVWGNIPGCPNLGYLIGDSAFLHPGDALIVPECEIEVLALPIDGPWLKLAEVIDYVRALRPAVALTIHEGELTDPDKYAAMLDALTGDDIHVVRPVVREALHL